MELIEKLVDHGDGERVLDGERVEGAVVDAESPRPVGLLDEDDGRGERRVAASDDALSDHGSALPL